MKYSALCCYFGQWPNYFQFWLKSCSYNTGIHFILVSDIPTEGYDVPENVQIFKKSFAEVQTLVAQKFPEITISLDRPYKLCDFKTAYGYIFADLFEGYDYWGFCDIDTIWGNIEKFIPENSDSHLVKIFPCGHLCFIRNIAPWNRVFELVNQVAGTLCRNNMNGRTVATWQECFSSPESHYYDEEGGLEPLFQKISTQEVSVNYQLSIINFVEVSFDNLLPPWRFDHFYSINFPEKSNHLVYSFKEGCLMRHYLQNGQPQAEEISYLHISKRRFSIHTNCTSSFVVYPNRFASYRECTKLPLLIHGRKRYLSNLLRRIISRIQPFV